MNEIGMVCGVYRRGLIELARDGPLDLIERCAVQTHIDDCPLCRREFEAQVRLSNATRRLADDAASLPVSPMPDQALLAEFDKTRGTRVRRVPYWTALGAVAALVLAALVIRYPAKENRPAPVLPPPVIAKVQPIARVTAPPPEGPPPAAAALVKPRTQLKRRRAAQPAKAREVPLLAETDQPFVPIPYTAPLSPYERADVVQVEVPVSALIAAGFPFQVSDAGARARADLVVGEDGRARAVRLISISGSDSYRSFK